MKSKLFFLNIKDVIKGFVMAVLGALTSGVYQAINNGGIEFTWVFWHPIVYFSIGAGLLYLIKNFFTGEGDKLFTNKLPSSQ